MNGVNAGTSPVLLSPCDQYRNEDFSHKDKVDDIIRIDHIGTAGGMDKAAGVKQAGGAMVIGGIEGMGDSDSDSSSEASPGPAAWVAFQYITFDTLFSHF